MASIAPETVAQKPLWRRIVDFPLVAMVIAVALLVGTIGLAGLGIRQLPDWGIPDASRQMIAGLVLVGLAIAVYKFAICKLGEHPRDDLRDEHGLRDLSLGLGGGALLFSLVAAVAAVGIGVKLSHQRLVGALDVLGLRLADDAQRLERAPVLLMQRLDPLGNRLLRLAMAVFGKHAKRVAIFVAWAQGFARRAGGRSIHPGISGGKAGSRLGLGRRMQRRVELLLVHVGKEVEGRVVVADMLEAEMMILPFAAGALGRTILTGQLAAFPVTHVLNLRSFFFLARLDAN